MSIIILGIESSCDDTSAAILKDGVVLSNIIASQKVHEAYGGVVPELASRAHQQNIIPVVSQAIKNAGIEVKDIDAVAFTRGPGLLGSLLVGTSFAKGFAIANQLPMIEVNHLQAHILANFIKEPGVESRQPSFPFLTLLVSGGNSQLIIVRDYLDMEMIGQTIDDAAGEAFDKCAKVMGLPYPGGPVIDRLAKEGNPDRFEFNKPQIPGLDYSFSGLKTSFLYFLRDEPERPLCLPAKNRDRHIDVETEKSSQANRNQTNCNRRRRFCKLCPAKSRTRRSRTLRLGSIYPPARFFARQCRNGCRDGVLQISGWTIYRTGHGSLCQNNLVIFPGKA